MARRPRRDPNSVLRNGGSVTERVDRASQAIYEHHRHGHTCPPCEIEMLRSVLALFAQAFQNGLLVWTGPPLGEDADAEAH